MSQTLHSADKSARPIPPIDANAPKKFETATFAMGCFWCPDYVFGTVPGVIRTRVGYSGGTKANPTYKDLGDHTEAIQIDYDPKTTSYDKMLKVFWEHHQPASRPYSRQYKCAVFYHDEAQKKLASESRQRLVDDSTDKIYTEVLSATKFYLAEDYHQKYELRHNKALMDELKTIYPSEKDFINSTVAARLNAFVSGHVDAELLKAEIDQYGLSGTARATLMELAKRSR